ncbi:hypothetical protein Cgig2_022527 [Carnegiea gigantea]|uniref:Uncharacterized protein n=1 Tax=Carnegiea gigantea TaxID=171969 RepID=A0A9Q1Q5Z7_9CARY|nr:hypothetical protein Cgig2_022527 [Carnegiea gigantea]
MDVEDDIGKQLQEVRACCNSPERCCCGEEKVGIRRSKEVKGKCETFFLLSSILLGGGYAKKYRAKLLRERKSANYSPHASTKMLEMVYRIERNYYSLAKAFEGLNISERSVKSMPSEQLAVMIGSDVTLKTVKLLLNWIEVHLGVWSSAGMENIDHLLERVATPKCKGNVGHPGRSRGQKRLVSAKRGPPSYCKLLRYPMRVVLCAYMILGHPEAVLSQKGVHKTSLTEAAVKFIREFELLIRIILDDSYAKSFVGYGHVTFRSQLRAFDKAWRLYLYCFVAWKVKNAKLLEEH